MDTRTMTINVTPLHDCVCRLDKKGVRIPLDVKSGDRILFGKYTGNDIVIDDQEFLILREEDILAKVRGIAKAASSKR